ncbi:unnamed protein product [Allacma fusca]|uniref:Uncharacterized protein n=1 Tax=Allacma fusca TaxID=39272 RepID=A0A8J2NQB6_9HEXA|nr:unnamed protein product [Allacma fusca]
MDRNSSNVPFSPRQKTFQTFIFEGDSHQNPEPTIVTYILSEDVDPGHLPKTSLKLIRKWIRKPEIQEAALRQYNAQVSRLVSTKAPFTEKDLKSFHQQVLREILSSFDSTFKDVLSSNPSLTQELQYERDKLKSAIKTQSRTFLKSYKTSIDTIKNKLKQCTLDAESEYIENMDHSLKSIKSIDEIHLFHEEWKTKAMQNFSDTLREKASLEVEPWMTQELKSRLEDKLEQIEEEFWDLKIASAYSVSDEKSLQTDYIIHKIFRKFGNGKFQDLFKNSAEEYFPDKIKQFLEGKQSDKLFEDKVSTIVREKLDKLVKDKATENSAEEHVPDKVKQFLESNHFDKLIEDKLSFMMHEKLNNLEKNMVHDISTEKFVSDKLEHFLESDQFHKLVEDKLSDIVQQKLDKLVEDNVSKLTYGKTPQIVDQLLKLHNEIDNLNSRFNASKKEHLIFKANLELFGKTSKQDYTGVISEIDNLKKDSEKNAETLDDKFEDLKNRFDKFQKEHKNNNVFIKSVPDAIKNVKGDNIDIVNQLAKLENDMKTLNENQVKQKTAISHFTQQFRPSNTTVQKLQVQTPSLEHQHKKHENGIKHPNHNKMSAPNTTSKKPLSYISKAEGSIISTTSTVSKPLTGGLAKSISPENNIVDSNANGKQMRLVVNQGMSKFQQQGQVATENVTGSKRQTPASRGHSTIDLVLEELSNPSTRSSVADRKAFFDKPQSSQTQLPQIIKQNKSLKSNLTKSVSTNSIVTPK